MKEKTKIINAVFYVLILTGFTINIVEYFLHYISEHVLLRATIIYFLCLCLFFLINIFSNKVAIWLKIIPIIIIIIIITTFSIIYIKYLYTIDVAIIVIPQNYRGEIRLNINDKSSNNKTKPLDGVVLLRTDNKGNFITCSNLSLNFTNIMLAEGLKGKISTNRKLKLINKRIFKDPLRIVGEIVDE